MNGGDYHVYTTVLALTQLGHQITLCHPKVLEPLSDEEKPYEYLVVEEIAMALFPVQLHVISHEEYFMVVEFLWFGHEYMNEVKAINSVFRKYSPRTSLVAVLPDIWHRRLQTASGTPLESCKLCLQYYQHEMEIWKQVNIIAGVNSHLVDYAQTILPDAVFALAPYAQLPVTPSNVPWSKRRDLIYYGSPYRGNNLAVDVLAKDVAPRLFEALGVTVHIYGGFDCPACEASRGCVLHGFVSTEGMQDAIREARWMVAPVVVEAGVSTKIVTALSLGTPVLTTPLGLGGMENAKQPFPIVVAELRNLTATLLSIYNDEQLWLSKQQIAADFAENYFGMTYLKLQMSDILSKAAKITEHKHSLATRAVLKVAWELTVDSSSVMYSFQKLLPYLTGIQSKVISTECASKVDVYVRLKHEFDGTRPGCCPVESCKFISHFDWETLLVNPDAVSFVQRQVDAVWAFSLFQSKAFHSNGIDADKIREIPIGVNCAGIKSTGLLPDVRSKYGISMGTKVFGMILGEHAERSMKVVLHAFEISPEVPYLLVFFSRKPVPAINLPPTLNTRVIQDPNLNNYDIYRAVDVLLLPVGSELSVSQLEGPLFHNHVIAPNNGIAIDYLPKESLFYTLVPGDTQPLATEVKCTSLGLGEACNTKSFDSLWVVPNGKAFSDAVRGAAPSDSGLARNSSRLVDFICEHYDWKRISDIVLVELKVLQRPNLL